MFKLFIFDLDNTLIPSDELETFRGKKNLDNSTPEFATSLLGRALEKGIEPLITPQTLQRLAKLHPAAKFAVFTTAPRFYASTLIAHFYPSIPWCAVIGFEDVESTKPSPEGIYAACVKADLQDSDDLPFVVMIGDTEKDIQAAYQAGCRAVLYTGHWPQSRTPENWRAVALLPDATVNSPEELIDAITSPETHLLTLESLIACGGASRSHTLRAITIRRFSKLDGDNSSVAIKVLGRLFSEYEAFDIRREWHELTEQIHAHKDAETFPEVWIEALRDTIGREIRGKTPWNQFGKGIDCIITCIPRKPDRAPRLEHLIKHLEESNSVKHISAGNISFMPDLLAFKEGVKSHHRDHLKAKERFQNVADHLEVSATALAQIQGKIVFVIDDVVTSGATFFCADKSLRCLGAKAVVSIALAQAVSPSPW